MTEHEPDQQPLRPGFRPLAEIAFALSFLTRLPLPFLRTLDPPPMAKAMRFFPLAGLIVGAVCASVFVSARYVGCSALLSSVLCLTTGVLLTGALHEDGLADMADGLGGHNKVERLLIMRDSRIGSYGVIALILLFLGRVAILQVLYTQTTATIFCVLIAAAAFSRALMVDLLWATRPARSDGLSALVGRPRRGDALFALLLGGGMAFFAITAYASAVTTALALASAALMLGLIRTIAVRKFGGQTGDICGAAQVLTEIAILIVTTAMIG